MDSAALKKELLKASRLGNIQAGLPPAIRFAPALVIATATAASRLTGGSNLAERLLGYEEPIRLAAPEDSKNHGRTHNDRETRIDGENQNDCNTQKYNEKQAGKDGAGH